LAVAIDIKELNLNREIRWKIVQLYRFIAGRKQFRMLNELLFDCSTHALGIRNYDNDVVSGEKYFVEKILPTYLNPEQAITIVDVGANEGSYTELLLSKFNKAQCICIEPHPITFKALQQKLGSSAKLVNCAVGANPGSLTLYDRTDSEASENATFYQEIISEIHEQCVVSYPVTVKTLDDLAEELGLDRIDFLKIDTEGHELEVLRGASKLIEKGAIEILQVEFNEMNVISRVFLRDILNLLPNYRAYRLLPSGAIDIPKMPLKSELFGFQNIIFVPATSNKNYTD
jgi:FkbM family methyltransferase